MKEKTLLTIAFVVSFIGVLFLFILCSFIEIDLTLISDIDGSFLDKKVRVEGEVKSVKESSSMTMFNVEDKSGEIKVVVFSDEYIDLSGFVVVEGKIMEYEGEYEINAERISR
jgi:RecJ-like exonuclease